MEQCNNREKKYGAVQRTITDYLLSKTPSKWSTDAKYTYTQPCIYPTSNTHSNYRLPVIRRQYRTTADAEFQCKTKSGRLHSRSHRRPLTATLFSRPWIFACTLLIYGFQFRVCFSPWSVISSHIALSLDFYCLLSFLTEKGRFFPTVILNFNLRPWHMKVT